MNSRSNQLMEETSDAVVIFSIMLIITVNLLFGCSSPQIKDAASIVLTAGQPSEGVSKTNEYVFNYKIVYRQMKSDGTGKIELRGRVVPNKDLESLRINLNCIGSDGKILGSKWIYPPGAGLGLGIATLRETYDTPPGTVAISFSHFSRLRRIRNW